LYVRLCNAGCSLFQHWKAIFYCNADRQRETRVEFGKKGNHVLKSGVSHLVDSNVVQDINDLCKFLEECLGDWLNHISVMRTESYYLNHFTTQQLVILQNELAKVNLPDGKKAMSNCVFPLLSTIRRTCSFRDLERAMHAAFQELASMEKTNTKRSQSPMLTDRTDEINAKELSEFFETMSESGFSVKLVERALKAVGANAEEGKFRM
jgi:hypothetical protein